MLLFIGLLFYKMHYCVVDVWNNVLHAKHENDK